MKQCSECKQIKQLTDFPKRGKDRNLRANCKQCYNEFRQKAYKANAEIKAKYKSRQQLRTWTIRRQLISYLQDHPCVDCGESNVLALEFDHVEQKTANIGGMGKESWPKVLAEIQKCEVRCGTCHRIKTHQRANSVRYQIALSLSLIHE